MHLIGRLSNPPEPLSPFSLRDLGTPRSDERAAALRQQLSEAYDIVVVGPPPHRDSTSSRTPGD
jgi:hypothetical protein